jgi:hypothetical protein
MVFKGDGLTMSHESAVVLLEVWKQTVQGGALGAWDHFRGANKVQGAKRIPDSPSDLEIHSMRGNRFVFIQEYTLQHPHQSMQDGSTSCGRRCALHRN